MKFTSACRHEICAVFLPTGQAYTLANERSNLEQCFIFSPPLCQSVNEHRCRRTIETFARQQISRSRVRPSCCPFSAYYNWHRTQWLLLMTRTRIPAVWRQSCLQPFSGMFVFPQPAQSSAPQRVKSYFDIPTGAERQQLVKAKSVIKPTGLTLKLKPEAPQKDFLVLFFIRLLPNWKASFLFYNTKTLFTPGASPDTTETLTQRARIYQGGTK